MEQNIICPNCKKSVSSEIFFCPNCGKKLKEKPLSVTIPRQIFVFMASALLAPFGLWWANKYLRQNDKISKRIGITIIIITIIATAIILKISIDTMDVVNRDVTKQLQQYQNF